MQGVSGTRLMIRPMTYDGASARASIGEKQQKVCGPTAPYLCLIDIPRNTAGYNRPVISLKF